MIELTFGGRFRVQDLINHITASGRDYIIQGQQACSKANHRKPQSLDHWLRQYGHAPDTKQADNEVMNQLLKTGRFKLVSKLRCPDTGNMCKGLVLINRST